MSGYGNWKAYNSRKPKRTQCTLALQENDDAADTTIAVRDGSLPYVHAQMCQNKMAESVNKYVYLTNEALKNAFLSIELMSCEGD